MISLLRRTVRRRTVMSCLALAAGIVSLGVAGAEGGVAFFAHIGGFVAGAAIGLLIRGSVAGRGRQARLPRTGMG